MSIFLSLVLRNQPIFKDECLTDDFKSTNVRKPFFVFGYWFYWDLNFFLFKYLQMLSKSRIFLSTNF